MTQAWFEGLHVHSSGYGSHGAGRVLDVREGLVVYESLEDVGLIEVLPICAETTFYRSEASLRAFVDQKNALRAEHVASYKAAQSRMREASGVSVKEHRAMMEVMAML